jgi:hypothetical protein
MKLNKEKIYKNCILILQVDKGGGVAELVVRPPMDPKVLGLNPGASGESVGSNCEHKYSKVKL